MSPLPVKFYQRDTEIVARELLGKRLVRHYRGRKLSGIIVETEAYLGLKDPAAHTYHGKVTHRTKTFYLDGGHAYVYMIYGMYHCFNVVTGDAKTPEAVLVRALALDGDIDYFRKKHTHLKTAKIAAGPGRLCTALKIDKSLNGRPLNSQELYIEEGLKIPQRKILASPRIGIDYAQKAIHWPLRFTVSEHPSLSR